MNKVFVLISIVLLGHTFVYPQSTLREEIAIVRPSYHESAVTFLADLEKSLQKDGYTQAAEMLKASMSKSFGSGFLYIDKESKQAYIITNKHVVAHAQWVDIEFMTADRTSVKYDKCPVVAIDEKYDIAAVALRRGAPQKGGLPLSSQTLADGSEIIAAGYPGLNKEPAWQLSKGIVANTALNLPEISGEDITIVQHTAEIDPGSSGGPLLVKNPQSNEYEVVGVNTWKITGQGHVNLAIPASIVAEFIRRDLHAVSTDTDELTQRVADFVRAGKTDYRKLLPFISYKYMSNLTADGFWELLNNASENRREMIYSLFTQGQAIDAIRVTLADAMCRLLTNKTASVGEVRDFTSVTDPVTVMLKYGAQPATSVWISEQGHWRITEFSPLKINKYGKKGIDDEFGYRRGIRAGIGLPFSKTEKPYASLTYSKTIYTYLLSEWTFDIGRTDVKSKTEPTDKEEQIKPESYFGINYGLGVQLPIKVSNVYFVPRIKGFIGWDIGNKTGRAGYGAAAGMQIAYKMRRMNYLLGGIDYRYRTFFKKESSSNLFPAFSSIEAYVGITF